MSHAAARVPIVTTAAALGLEVKGRLSRCYNAAAHSDGDDARPSLTFFSDSNRYYCFACGVKGDVIDLVKAVKRCGFKAAVEWLQGIVGGPFPEREAAATVTRARTPDEEATEIYAALYESSFLLEPQTPAAAYLRGRRLDPELVGKHGAAQMGNPDDVWGGLIRKFGFERLHSAGLVSRSDRFLFARHRLLFFYFDDGWPVYVQARNVEDETQPKELSLAGLHSPVPYNVDLLRAPRERIYVCEGCIDTLSAVQMGLPAVGVPGVQGFRKAWFDLFRGVGHVVLLFDNDEAGRRQAAELRSQFRLRGVRADAIHPKEEKDMNDLLKKLKGE